MWSYLINYFNLKVIMVMKQIKKIRCIADASNFLKRCSL